MPIISGGGGSASTLPKGYLYGGRLRYVSTTTATIEALKARSSDDSADLSLAAQATLNLATVNASSGIERKTLTGTITTNGTAAVTGTSSAFLTEFAPGNTPRTLTGTIGTGGAASTTITGSGTKFTREVKLNDLVGNSSVGYAKVTSIVSDTSLVVVSNLTIANGSTGKVIENPTLEDGNGGAVRRVDAIASDTALTVDSRGIASSHTVTGYTGSRDVSTWLVIWVCAGGFVFLSTQRTTPFLTIASVGSTYRAVGALRLNSTGSGEILAFSQSGLGTEREYQWQVTAAVDNLRVVSNGVGATSTWVKYEFGGVISPFATGVRFVGHLSGGSLTTESWRPRNIGTQGASASVSAGRQATLEWIAFPQWVDCDDAQGVDAMEDAGTTGVYCDVSGYKESL